MIVSLVAVNEHSAAMTEADCQSDQSLLPKEETVLNGRGDTGENR